MNISFALTTPQFRSRTKDVTRRLGWRKVKLGQILNGIEKGQGLKKGEHPVHLGQIRVKSARREALNLISKNLDYGFRETEREGFSDPHPCHCPSAFVEMFCKHNGCTPETEITRIEFEYL